MPAERVLEEPHHGDPVVLVGVLADREILGPVFRISRPQTCAPLVVVQQAASARRSRVVFGVRARLVGRMRVIEARHDGERRSPVPVMAAAVSSHGRHGQAHTMAASWPNVADTALFAL